MIRAVGIVVAAGRSTRLLGERPKQLLELGGETLAARAARFLGSVSGIEGVVVVLPHELLGTSHESSLRALATVRGVVAGGASRMLSVLAGAEAAEGADVVLVHDAARPFATRELASAVLDAAARHGAAVPALPVRDTIKRDDGAGWIAGTVERTGLHLAQTPQGARRDWLVAAIRDAASAGDDATDEAQALERAGKKVALVPGDPGNVKITTPDDWEAAMRRAMPAAGEVCIGHGYDVHRFGGGGPLRLGGVTIEGAPGLAGHSDADVVLHAAMDAVLGAAGLPDIGHHFPPGDPAYAGADSATLARRVAEAVAGAGWHVVNLDLTLLAERPKIAPHVAAMRAAIGACFGLPADRVGLKATTLEGLGSLGRGEGIACHAVALLGARAVR